jgi:hypothetical protein
MIGYEKTSAEAEETIRRAEIMMQAVYNEDGICTNMEVRLKAIEDPDRWDISRHPSWNWNEYDYRVVQEKPKAPEPVPMDFSDMVDRLKQGKGMYVVKKEGGNIMVITRIVSKEGRPNPLVLILAGDIIVNYTQLAEEFCWADTGLPCVKPTE